MRTQSITIVTVLLWTCSIWGQDVAPLPPPGFNPDEESSTLVEPPPPLDDVTREYGIRRLIPSNPSLYGLRGGPGATAYPSPARPLGPVDPNVVFPSGIQFRNVWFSAEALAWWSKASPIPVPLVTDGTSLAAGSPVILGNQNLALPVSSGGRFTLGFGFGAERTWAAEGSYFFLGNGGASQGVTADGHHSSAELSFPFYNPNLPGEDSTPIALPGKFAGTAIVSVTSFLQGFDANILHNVGGGGYSRFDLLGGFRYVNLQENLTFSTDSPNVYPNPPAYFRTFDSFDTHNNFYGGQVGGRASFDNGMVFFNATGKLALGDSVQTVGINGGTFTNYLGPNDSAQGAYLTQPSNIGSQTVSRFAVIPEMNMNIGFYLTPWVRFNLGYSFLYISSVARPGNQIDHVINPTQAPAINGNFPSTLSGVARPGANVQSSDFWAQGLNLGVEFRY